MILLLVPVLRGQNQSRADTYLGSQAQPFAQRRPTPDAPYKHSRTNHNMPSHTKCRRIAPPPYKYRTNHHAVYHANSVCYVRSTTHHTTAHPPTCRCLIFCLLLLCPARAAFSLASRCTCRLARPASLMALLPSVCTRHMPSLSARSSRSSAEAASSSDFARCA